MRGLIVMGCVLCWLGAGIDATMFDEELYKSALHPELCADQWENVDRYQFPPDSTLPSLVASEDAVLAADMSFNNGSAGSLDGITPQHIKDLLVGNNNGDSSPALLVYDPSFRVPQGITYGNFKDYGNFHQCLAINRNYPGRSVQGKYCVISAHLSPPILRIPSLGGASDSNNLTWTEVKLNRSKNDSLLLDANVTEPLGSLMAEPVTLQLAVCVPRACAPDALLRPYADHPLVRFNYSLDFCRLPADMPYAAAEYVALFIFLLLGLLTVSSTTYELHHMFILKKEWHSADERLSAFSLHRNARLVLAPAAAAAAAPGALHCLHGIRALSVLWIIIFHSMAVLLSRSINKKAIILHNYLWISNGHLAVDSFLLLSGLLLVYTTACKSKSLELRSLPLFYLSRYVRLFPLLALTVLLQAAVALRVVDGPKVKTYFAYNVGKCRRYWWSTLLHVQNIVNPEELCLSHSWYLSVDMQLYVVAALMQCGVRRVRSVRATWIVLFSVLLAGLAATIAICFYFDFPYIGPYTRDTGVYWTMYYRNTITRSPPFLIGILVGYGLHVSREDKFRIPKWSIFLWYSVALVLSSLTFFAYYPSTWTLWENQAALNTKYSLDRLCWALALGWLILACNHGYGGPVNWFLSLRLWQFVSRISYAMYLLSFVIQDAENVASDMTYFDMHSLLWQFSGDLVCTLVLSVVASILVEAPLLTLYKLLLKPRPKQES